MATEKQKEAARHNLEKARAAQGNGSGKSARAGQSDHSRQSSGAMSTAEKDQLKDQDFAFPKQRKEPLTDASHVRNAVARFDQVQDVSDAERDQAWDRIQTAARKFDIDLSEKSWRELAHGGRDN